MPDYRLYCLDGIRHIASGEWFEADSDDEAIAIVTAKKLRIRCEILVGTSVVAAIPAYRPAAA